MDGCFSVRFRGVYLAMLLSALLSVILIITCIVHVRLGPPLPMFLGIRLRCPCRDFWLVSEFVFLSLLRYSRASPHRLIATSSTCRKDKMSHPLTSTSSPSASPSPLPRVHDTRRNATDCTADHSPPNLGAVWCSPPTANERTKTSTPSPVLLLRNNFQNDLSRHCEIRLQTLISYVAMWSLFPQLDVLANDRGTQ